jgi:FkbM family methyltransferase
MKRSLAFLKRTLVSVLKRSFRTLGYEIVSDSGKYMTMDGGIARLRERKIALNSVIDVGASNGRWTELCMKYFPEATYHLFEAQKEYGSSLESLRSRYPQISYSLCVASDEAGDIYFDDHIVGGGIASREKPDGNFKKMTASTIDKEVTERGLKGPFLIKLDTHGFEVPILEGAKETLKQASVLIIECYNFNLNPTCIKFSKMVDYLEQRGFSCIDMVDVSLRKSDSVLWQMDIFFAKSDMDFFSNRSYN